MTAKPSATLRCWPLVAALCLALGLAPAVQAQSNKLAVIDVQRILSNSATGKKAQENMEQVRSKKKAELEAKQQELKDLQKRISDQQLSLAEDRLAELQKELEDKVIAYRRAEDDANREVQKQGEKLVADMERLILPVIDKIGKEQGFTLIFNKYQSGLLYADNSIDITDLVIQRLDASGAGGK